MSILDTSNCERDYPLYRTVRLRKDNILKIKKRATKYGQSFDDIVTEMISVLESFENEKKRSTMT
jgi:hypothetical protein